MVSYLKMKFKTILCLARLLNETARVFSESFFEKETAFFSSSAPRTCSVPRQDFFWILSSTQFRKKCHFNSQKLSAILIHGEKNFVMMTSIVRLSCNRS